MKAPAGNPYEVFDRSMSDAHRDLITESAVGMIDDLPWLTDSTLIPHQAMHYLDDRGVQSDPYTNVAVWMLTQFSNGAEQQCPHLRYDAAYKRHGIPAEKGALLHLYQLARPGEAYGPGMHAMAQIHEVIPSVAARDGLPVEDWAAIASQARKFGQKYALDGTVAQVLTRFYLSGAEEVVPFKPERLKLDNKTGVTSVTPIADIVETARDAATRHRNYPEGMPDTCLAMFIKPPELDGKSLYDATWDAYSEFVAREVYPQVKPEQSTEADPDIFYRIEIGATALRQRLREDAEAELKRRMTAVPGLILSFDLK
jgi:hypothetical protein